MAGEMIAFGCLGTTLVPSAFKAQVVSCFTTNVFIAQVLIENLDRFKSVMATGPFARATTRLFWHK